MMMMMMMAMMMLIVMVAFGVWADEMIVCIESWWIHGQASKYLLWRIWRDPRNIACKSSTSWVVPPTNEWISPKAPPSMSFIVNLNPLMEQKLQHKHLPLWVLVLSNLQLGRSFWFCSMTDLFAGKSYLVLLNYIGGEGWICMLDSHSRMIQKWFLLWYLVARSYSIVHIGRLMFCHLYTSLHMHTQGSMLALICHFPTKR